MKFTNTLFSAVLILLLSAVITSSCNLLNRNRRVGYACYGPPGSHAERLDPNHTFKEYYLKLEKPDKKVEYIEVNISNFAIRNLKKGASIKDFTDLKRIKFTKNHHTRSEITPENLVKFYDWLIEIDQLKEQIHIEFPTNISIPKLSNIAGIILNFQDYVDSTIYNIEDINYLYYKIPTLNNSEKFNDLDFSKFKKLKNITIKTNQRVDYGILNRTINYEVSCLNLKNIALCMDLEGITIEKNKELSIETENLKNDNVTRIRVSMLGLDDNFDWFSNFKNLEDLSVTLIKDDLKQFDFNKLRQNKNLKKFKVRSDKLSYFDFNTFESHENIEDINVTVDSLEQIILPIKKNIV